MTASDQSQASNLHLGNAGPDSTCKDVRDWPVNLHSLSAPSNWADSLNGQAHDNNKKPRPSAMSRVVFECPPLPPLMQKVPYTIIDQPITSLPPSMLLSHVPNFQYTIHCHDPSITHTHTHRLPL